MNHRLDGRVAQRRDRNGTDFVFHRVLACRIARIEGDERGRGVEGHARIGIDHPDGDVVERGGAVVEQVRGQHRGGGAAIALERREDLGHRLDRADLDDLAVAVGHLFARVRAPGANNLRVVDHFVREHIGELDGVARGIGGGVDIARVHHRDRPAGEHNARQQVGDGDVGQDHVAGVGHGEAVRDDIARDGTVFETGRVGDLVEGDRRRLGDRHHRRVVVARGRPAVVGDRVSARIVARDGGLVGHLARSNVGLGDRIGRGEGRGVHVTRRHRRDRPAAQHDARQDVGQRHIGQCHVTGVGHFERVADDVAGLRRAAEGAGIGGLDERDPRSLDDCGHQRIVVAGGCAAVVGDHGAEGIGAARGRLVGDRARVDIGLADRIGRGKGRGVAVARIERGDGTAREHDARQDIGERDVGQRHVAGVHHLEGIGDLFEGHRRVGQTGRVGSLDQRNRRGDRGGERGRVVFARLVALAVAVRVGVRAVVRQIGELRVGGRGLAALLAFRLDNRLVLPAGRHRRFRLDADAEGERTACPHPEREAGGDDLIACAVEAGIGTAAAARGRGDDGIGAVCERVVDRIGRGRADAEQRVGPGERVGHLDVDERLQAEVFDHQIETRGEGAVDVAGNAAGQRLGDADAGLRDQGEIVIRRIGRFR